MTQRRISATGLPTWICLIGVMALPVPGMAQGLFNATPDPEVTPSDDQPLFQQFRLSPPEDAAPDAADSDDPQGSAGTGTIPSAATADGDGVIAEVVDPVTSDPETAPEGEPEDAASTESGAAEETPEAPASSPPLRPQSRPEQAEAVTEDAAPAPAPTGPICGDAVTDADITRNATTLRANPTLCVAQEVFTEHGRRWSLLTITDISRRRGPRWAVLHDNEDAAFDAAIYALTKYGGAMIAIDGDEGRNVQGQDPNRNFGLTRQIAAPCGGMQTKPAPTFTRALNRMFLRRPLVLSLHSNHDGHAEDGMDGAGDISAARSTDTRRGFLATKPVEGLSDADNAILIAGLTPYENTPAAQDLVAHMGPLGINVIYEQVTPETNDCSLSAHAVLNKMGDYYNIEVEHGRLDDQKIMLDVLMEYLGVEATE
ncbi:hypothetical protein [Pseudooceanicola sp. MF1-13]|uniref:hypothetical protein n=1 Tax=Pseudooceanicola sp. MF1-13 TaxID=3379095 RepID=UPI0038920785